jgi:hypothetical protein
MTQPAPSFPAFDEWEKMSESEQDALLDRLETKQRGSIMRWVLIGTIAFAAALAGIWLAR